MNFILEGAVAAFASLFLLAAAVSKSAARSNAPFGVLATLVAVFFAASVAAFPNFSKNYHNPTASIVLDETILVLFHAHILQSRLKNLTSSPVFSLNDRAASFLIVDNWCLPPTLYENFLKLS